MKNNRKKSLTLVKASIANLENNTLQQIKGGETNFGVCDRSMYPTSCHVH